MLFAEEIGDFNPECVHQDSAEFLQRVIFDKLHESLKPIYVSNEAAKTSSPLLPEKQKQ